MFAALLTVLLFSVSGIAGERSARYLGGQRANLLRLFFATAVMGVVTVVFFRESIRTETFGWLFFSGIVGFGLGDIALFLAYVRIGARLTILLNLCTAPLWSALLERVWLGTTLSGIQLFAGGIILAGVAMALLARPPGGGQGSRVVGILCGLTAGCGQGLGAVISRKAFEVATVDGFVLNGMSAAAQRVLGGFFTALVVWAVIYMIGKSHSRPKVSASQGKKILWLAATTLCGPILGVSCFQWSLMELPSAISTAVVATTPIAMIPLAIWIDRERLRPLSVLGAITAVAGVVLLVLIEH